MDYDIIVIGSGPGGYVAAIRAAQLGRKVAVVERAQLGGICLNWGCIPSKALLKSAQVYGYAKKMAEFGVELEGTIRPDIKKMVERSRTVSEQMRAGVAFLLKKNGVEVIAGRARLKGGGIVEVTKDGAAQEFSAGYIILATGTRARELPSAPMDGTHIINYRQAMTLDRIPESMVVIGSGAIGCEFGYFYSTLGTKVTIIEYQPNILPLGDEDVSKQMERSFRKMKVDVLTSTAVKEVKVSDGKCRVVYERKGETKEIEAEVVLSAVGVKSNIEHIGLEEAGVKVEHDKVVVNNYFRTSAEGVYAIGDIVSSPALAHVASAEGVCCVEAICGLNPEPINYDAIPAAVYTSPEAAGVGLSEKHARERGFEIKTGVYSFMASGKATAVGERDGFVKLVFDAGSGKLLGGHAVGSNVSEIVGELAVACRLGLGVDDIARTIHCHPTMYESIAEAAEASEGKAINIL